MTTMMMARDPMKMTINQWQCDNTVITLIEGDGPNNSCHFMTTNSSSNGGDDDYRLCQQQQQQLRPTQQQCQRQTATMATTSDATANACDRCNRNIIVYVATVVSCLSIALHCCHCCCHRQWALLAFVQEFPAIPDEQTR